jgi:1-deoxy-D-xylulose-5-phosphate reductoisomerase
MATFTDGTTMAQLSLPDMRLPISYALAYPDRIGTSFGRLDFGQALTLDFEPPDAEAFGCLALAYEAGRSGDSAPAWLSAANEVVVEAFLDGRLAWTDIAAMLADVLAAWPGWPANTLDEVLAADEAARRCAIALLAGRKGTA